MQKKLPLSPLSPKGESASLRSLAADNNELIKQLERILFS
jgi:hypothetical protein